MTSRRKQALVAGLALLLAICGVAHAMPHYEAGEFHHDLADMPGGAKLKERLEGSVPVASVPAGAALRQAGSMAAGAYDLASQVAAALGADKLDDDKDVPQPTPPKMIEVLSDQVDVAVPDPKAPQLAPATDDGPQKASALGSTVQPSAARPGAVNPAAAKPGAVKPPAAKPPAAKPPKDSYALPATQLSAPRAVGLEDLRATVGSKRSHKFYYQIPANPRAVVLMIHGCAHSGANWFPVGPTCQECRPLPEQLSHTLQALRRGYAVVAISSRDQESGCWSWATDCYSVRDSVKEWLTEHKLESLPLYGLGVSSGAAFTLKMARFLQFSGVMSEALGIDEAAWGLKAHEGPYPPTVFVSMDRDAEQRVKIQQSYEILKARGSPVGIIKSFARKVYPTYFSDRNPYGISDSFSRKIVQGLKDTGFIKSDGTVTENPRYTLRPWLAQLKGKVPELQGNLVMDQGRSLPPFPPGVEDLNSNAVWSLMNLAYNEHEIISDYATAVFMWFESGGKGPLKDLVAKNTYSKGPPISQGRRGTLELPTQVVPQDVAQGLSAATQQLSEDARVQQLARDAGLAGAAAKAEAALRASAQHPRLASALSAFAGAPASGAAAMVLVAGLVWLVVRQQRGAAPVEGLMMGAAQAAHPAPRLPSIIPGVRERFELTEVVEQTGSPFSARRRVRTAFHPDSPAKSPKKQGGL